MKKAGAAAAQKGQKAAAAPDGAPAKKSMKTGKAKAAAGHEAAIKMMVLETKVLELDARVKHLEDTRSHAQFVQPVSF